MFMTNFNVVGQQMADNKGPVGLKTGGSNIIMNSILVEVVRSTFILFVSHQTSQKILQQNAYVSCMVNPERQIHNKILCIQYFWKSSERLIGEVIQTRWSNELVNQIRWSNKLINQDGQIKLVWQPWLTSLLDHHVWLTSLTYHLFWLTSMFEWPPQLTFLIIGTGESAFSGCLGKVPKTCGWGVPTFQMNFLPTPHFKKYFFVKKFYEFCVIFELPQRA